MINFNCYKCWILKKVDTYGLQLICGFFFNSTKLVLTDILSDNKVDITHFLKPGKWCAYVQILSKDFIDQT